MAYPIYLGLGSNKDPERHLKEAIETLESTFGEIILSPVYRSSAVGFEGEDFLNAVALVQTDWGVGEIKHYLTDLEDQHGRDRNQPKFSDRVLDIDLLLYDDWIGEFDGLVLPRDEITRYAHVLKPLADLAPDLKHPGLDQTYATLWATFDGDRSLVRHPFEMG
ncbi:MAG TPA: 2-amino-4-hydroxy-6-hydroxymethyldihydropteridine diphosphokinase [Wenzhouxiangella sp.]